MRRVQRPSNAGNGVCVLTHVEVCPTLISMKRSLDPYRNHAALTFQCTQQLSQMFSKKKISINLNEIKMKSTFTFAQNLPFALF